MYYIKFYHLVYNIERRETGTLSENDGIIGWVCMLKCVSLCNRCSKITHEFSMCLSVICSCALSYRFRMIDFLFRFPHTHTHKITLRALSSLLSLPFLLQYRFIFRLNLNSVAWNIFINNQFIAKRHVFTYTLVFYLNKLELFHI